jgi:hypothetical protein
MTLNGGEGRPVFFHDPGLHFGGCLFYGIEWQLIVWNTLVFATIDAKARRHCSCSPGGYGLGFRV